MSENEKYEQVGRLAEQLGQLKGELNHVEQKLEFCRQGFEQAANALANNTIRIDAGKLLPPQGGVQFGFQTTWRLNDLLNSHELAHALEERRRLRKEVEEATTRLRALAPHLL